MFTLSPLPYDYSALEPWIDEETMHLHHDKHHQTYVDNLNKIIAANPKLENKSLEELLFDPKTKNMAGGVFNHNLFWKFLDPKAEKLKPDEEVKNKFTTAALALFGSGWVWLTENYEVITTPNQDAPEVKVILGLDVWEHAYYLKYQNRRKDYIEAFWKLVS